MRKPLIASLLLAAATVPAAARPLTAKDAILLPRLGETRISPDGQWLALTTSQVDLAKNGSDGELRIYRLPIATLDRPIKRIPKAYHPRWSPDGSRLLYCDGGAHTIVTCARGTWKGEALPKLGDSQSADEPVWAPDGKHIAFSSPVPATKNKLQDSGRLYDDTFLRRWNHYYDGRRVHLYVTEIGAKAAPRDVTPGNFDAYPTSGTFSNGDNFCFSPDSRALLFAAPPLHSQARDTNYDVFRVDLKSGAKTNLTQDNPAADMGPRISADGKRLYIVSYTRPGYESDFNRIRFCSIGADGVPSGKWQVEEPRSEMGVGDYQPLAKGTLFSRSEEAGSRVYWQNSAGKTTLLNPTGALHGVNVGGGTWVGTAASLSHPARLVIGDLQTGRTQTLSLADFPKNIELGKVESVELPIPDSGIPMQMWLVKPPRFSASKKYPVAYLVHGGPQGGWSDDWSLRWNAQIWAAQGYVVAMPNPRGSSGRSRAFQEGVSRDWGGHAYADLMAGADYVAALPYVDKSRMIAAGASYGGYMVNWISVNTGRFRALVTHCGIWNLESEYGTTDELWFADWEMGGPPWGSDIPADYAKFSPAHYAEKLGVYKTPHLVIHNDLDYRCPINQGLELFTALKTQGVVAKFLNFPDEGHWVLKPRNSLRWHEEIFAFLAAHNR